MGNFTRRVCLIGFYLWSAVSVFNANAATFEQLKNDSTSARIAAAKVSCEGLIWEHGENLGKNDNRSVFTVIKENRIYISRDGADGSHNLDVISEVPAMLFHLSNNKFPIGQYQRQIDNCINVLDPSTRQPNYLGAITSEGIKCNNKLIKPDQRLGDYIGGDGVHTQHWITTDDNILRVTAFRNSNGNVRDPNSTSYNASLIDAIYAGENNSSFNWSNLGYTLSKDEFNGCFYRVSPKYGTILPNEDCGSPPVLNIISAVTKSSLNFSFNNGSGILSVNWKIKSGNTVVKSGQINIGNKSASITYSALEPGNYTLEIESQNCFSAKSSKAFVLESIITNPGDCASGPTITAISNISANALTFKFDGNGVSKIDWRIKQGNNQLAFGKTPQLTSNLINIAFNNLVSGNYTLEIQGGDCNSAVDVKPFIVANSDCASAPVLNVISAINNTSLNFSFTDGSGITSVNWKIKSATTVVKSGQASINNKSATIAYSLLASGSYSLEIESVNCTSANSSKVFIIPVQDCASGPTITAVSNISASSLTFKFDGAGVSNIDWRIKQGNNLLASGKTPQLTSNLINIVYNSLANGNYTLEIEGGDCNSSVDIKPFTVAVDPCGSAPTIASVSEITDSRLKINLSNNFSGNLNWNIRSNEKVVGYGISNLANTNFKVIDFNVLPIGNYKLSVFVDGCGTNNRVAASERVFDISSTSPLATCTMGPNLVKILSRSASSIKFNFHGTNVASIDWKIIENKPGGQVVFQNRVELTTDKPEVFYPSNLVDGNYKLQIQGGSCSSTPSSMNFDNGPLPIHISNFIGTSSERDIRLDWTVVDEENGLGFDVMRLNTESNTMESIGFVNLNDQKIGAYTFTDFNPFGGNNYYQLKQVDFDGSYIESRIINVKFRHFSELSVFPNPTSSIVNLNFVSNKAGAAIIETFGQSGVLVIKNVTTLKEGINHLPINIEYLPNGAYLIRLRHENEEKVFRFVKSN